MIYRYEYKTHNNVMFMPDKLFIMVTMTWPSAITDALCGELTVIFRLYTHMISIAKVIGFFVVNLDTPFH